MPDHIQPHQFFNLRSRDGRSLIQYVQERKSINKKISMMETLKKILGLGPSVDYAQLVKEGAVILDVRSKGEYAGGHIKGSINVSVDQLKNNLGRLDKQKTIITCCASGMRSGMAKSILESNGYKQVHNGGSWASLQTKI
jgi:phage shock protein E